MEPTAIVNVVVDRKIPAPAKINPGYRTCLYLKNVVLK
jgi:hypothetical protein